MVESQQAFTTTCPKCDADMTVEFHNPATPPEAGQPHFDLLVKPGAPPISPEVSPLPRRRTHDDEPKRKSGSGAIVFLSGGLVLLCVVGGLSLTGWFLFTQIDMTETVSAQPNNNPVGHGNKSDLVTPNVLPTPPRKRPGREGIPPVGRPAGEPAIQPQQPDPIRLELPPLPNPVEIRVAPVTEETPYKLPEPVRSLRVGGGGRFLILHFPKLRKFGVFDANEAKIVRYIAAPEEDVLYAAGMTKLVVFQPGSRVTERYDLLTGEREHIGTLDLPTGPVEAFCMGHASAGPLLVGVRNQGAMLFDITQFKEIPLPKSSQLTGYGFGNNAKLRLEAGNYWAGATGRVFGNTGNYGMPNGVKTVVLGDGGVQRYGAHVGTWFVVPGPDDKHVYAGGHGVISDRVTPVSNVPYSMIAGSGYASHLYLPAHHGPFYLHALTIGDVGRRKEEVSVGTVRLFMHGNKEPIATYEKTVVCKYGWQGLRGLGIEHSLHLIPKAKLLVIVPETRDELRLYPADLEAALDKAGRDYLYITSTPPTRFERGKAFTYQIEAKARKEPVTFRLESGPKGMTIDNSGLVRWTVPADFAEKRVDVIVLVKDKTGQEVFHTFTLADMGAK